MKDNWISIKDRLPRSNKMVLVFVPKPNEILGTKIVFSKYYSDKKRWYSFDFAGSMHIEVTHWQPLPEPPKKQKP